MLGCTTKTPSESVAEAAKDSVSNIENILPSECKTGAVLAEINLTKKLIDNTLVVCETEKEVIKVRSSRKDWVIAFLSLCTICLAYILLRKKF